MTFSLLNLDGILVISMLKLIVKQQLSHQLLIHPSFQHLIPLSIQLLIQQLPSSTLINSLILLVSILSTLWSKSQLFIFFSTSSFWISYFSSLQLFIQSTTRRSPPLFFTRSRWEWKWERDTIFNEWAIEFLILWRSGELLIKWEWNHFFFGLDGRLFQSQNFHLSFLQ